MTGVPLPGGGVLYGETADPPGLCGTISGGVLLPGGGRIYGTTPCPTGGGLPAVLLSAAVVLRASQIDQATFVDGDPWPNEGTAGPAYDAIADPDAAAPPAFVNDPDPGFTMGGQALAPNYQIPNGSAVNAGSGSFTVGVRVRYLGPDDTFEPLIAKVVGGVGAGGVGWIIATGTAIGPGIAFAMDDGDGFAGAISTDELVADTEYLIVGRRDGNDLSLFINSTLAGTGDASAVGSLNNTNPIIISRSNTAGQVGRSYGYWPLALTDTEITQQLPGAFA